MESILFSVDYASIIVYDSKFSIVYRPWNDDQLFCTTKKYVTDNPDKDRYLYYVQIWSQSGGDIERIYNDVADVTLQFDVVEHIPSTLVANHQYG